MSGPLRCAIYTRKSTEAGLEQDFNSLHAQREACLAYIKSQKHEGWTFVDEEYDDGGFSGGSLDRPALQKLMADISAGKVNIIVVYKVDRLTRSLADFAKIIELLDAHKASFVSVTQQFNTTSSMGRLTLNVLLSFAQFEREVTSERIRDKIAASKKKGLWMGGVPPLGYDVVDRKLVVNKAEAEHVRVIFSTYLELGTVQKLIARLDELKIQTKSWTNESGEKVESRPFGKTRLHTLLKSPVYIGKLPHHDQVYDGNHEPIVPMELWTLVQARFKEQWGERTVTTNQKSPCWLVGLLFDDQGKRFTNVKTTKVGRQYHYYVTGTKDEAKAGTGWRIPSKDIEQIVSEGVKAALQDPARLLDLIAAHGTATPSIRQLKDAGSRAEAICADATHLKPCLKRVEVRLHEVRVILNSAELRRALHFPTAADDGTRTITLPVQLRRRGVEARLVLQAPTETAGNFDPKLARWVAKAHVWFEQLKTGERSSIDEIAHTDKLDAADISRALPLAFISPSLMHAILHGAQPSELTAERLRRMPALPRDWHAQDRLLSAK